MMEERPAATSAIALGDAPLQGAATLDKRTGARLELIALDGEAEVVEAPRPGDLFGWAGGQEIDEVVAEAELHERELFVHALERAAEDLLVKAPGARLIAHPQHHVVEAERLEHGVLLPSVISVPEALSVNIRAGGVVSRAERRMRMRRR